MGIILKKLKSFFLFIIATFRRALCCFRKRRRLSLHEDDDQLTHVGVVSNQTVNEFEDWSNWNNDPSMERNRQPQTVQEHIEYYRKRQAQIASEQEMADRVEEDFFEDMTPKITKQAKVLIDDGSATNSELDNKGGISLVPEAVAYFGNELQEWEDTGGWDEDNVDIDQAIRESRKVAREKRAWEQQQKRLLEKSSRSLGTRIST